MTKFPQRKKTEDGTPKPWLPALYNETIIHAIKALKNKRATPEQQDIAWQWIVNCAAMVDDHSFFPGDPLVTAFIEGRRSVGLQMKKLADYDLGSKRGDIV